MTSSLIDVFTIRLDVVPSEVSELAGLLSEDETKRAAGFHSIQFGNRWIVARGRLRQILARSLGEQPKRLAFHYDVNGKPSLASLSEDPPLHFNLAHSQRLALLAVTRLGPVGIDIEALRADVDFESITQQYFSPHEQQALTSLAPEQRQRAFFAGWTRKEAFLKALGVGLGMPLSAFDVDLRPDREPALLAVEGSAERAQRWRIVHLEPADGYLGALAIEADARPQVQLHD